MKSLLVIASLFFSLTAAAQNSCGPTIQGGPDYFPWSVAQPFPWTKIQGLWRMQGDSSLVLKLKVVRQTSRIKQLEVELYSRATGCEVPMIKGIGLVNSSEDNVIRINLGNKLIKLAAFNTADLELNSALCGQQVLAISMIDLGSDFGSTLDSVNQYQAKNMLLKKFSASLDLNCKKRTNSKAL